MQPLDSYQSVQVPVQDKRDMMIELAKEEFSLTGQCLNNEVNHDEIMADDMAGSLTYIGDRAISGELNYDDIQKLRSEFESYVSNKIIEAVDDILFEEEIAAAGL